MYKMFNHNLTAYLFNYLIGMTIYKEQEPTRTLIKACSRAAQ